MKRKYRPFSIVQTFLLSITTLVIVIGVMVSYNSYIVREVTSQVETTLRETLMQQAHNFDTQIVSDKESMDLIALQLSKYQSTQDITESQLDEILSRTTFNALGVVDLDGNLHATGNTVTEISDRPYFDDIKAGRHVVTVIENSRMTGETVMIFAAPLTHQGVLYGSVIGTYDIENLQPLFLTSFQGKGYSYIVNDTGDLLVNSQSDEALLQTKSLYEWAESATFYGGDSFDTMLYNLKNGISGSTKMSYLGQTRILDYTPLDLVGWNMITAINTDVVDLHARKIVLASFSVSFGLVLVLAALISITIYSKSKREQELEQLVSYDTLTNALTIDKFRKDANAMLEKEQGKEFIMIKLDVADFKMVNRIHGYEQGNVLLKSIADCFRQLQQDYPTMLFTRFNTDEFMALIPIAQEDGWQQRAMGFYHYHLRQIEAVLNQPIFIPMGVYYFRASENLPISLVIERSIFAHRKAKLEAKSMVVFEEYLEVLMLQRNEIKIKYKQAISDKHIHVYLQPKVSLVDNRVVGAEALVRWMKHGKVVYYPDAFIPVLEEDESIIALDFFVLDEVCRMLSSWKQQERDLIPIAVNISRNHLDNPSFVYDVLAITNHYGIEPKWIELELTERIFLQEETALLHWLNQVQAAGFMVSMDDFGSGYSSLGLLRSIPVNTLKIDQSFLKTNETSERAKSIIEAVVQLSKTLGIKTVCEGVETKEQRDFLHEIGCDEVQGYYYAKPMAIPAFESLVENTDK